MLSGTYFVSANLYSSDTYLIIHGTLNDILTKTTFRRICHVWDFAAIRILPRTENFSRGQSSDKFWYHIRNNQTICDFQSYSIVSIDQFSTDMTPMDALKDVREFTSTFFVSRIYFSLSKVYNNLFSRVHLHLIRKLQPLFMYFSPPPDGAIFLEIVFKLCLNFI